MLNSNLVKLVEVLDKLCVEGYNTIDKVDILSGIENDYGVTFTEDVLMQEIQSLVENKFIILKYQDEEVICLTFTEVGKELLNRIAIARQNEQNSKKNKKEQKNNTPIATTNYDLTVPSSQNEIMSNFAIASVVNPDKKKNLKNFFIGLLGGILGGGISGAIITLLVLFL